MFVSRTKRKNGTLNTDNDHFIYIFFSTKMTPFAGKTFMNHLNFISIYFIVQ